jgi:hypothetical protein
MKKIIFPLVIFSALMLGGCTLSFSTDSNLPAVTPTIKPTVTVMATPTPSVDEASVIKATIKKALVAKHGESANELNVTVSKIVENYSQGGASGSGGGGMWFAAKVNNEWKLVWDGNGIILCSDLTNYPDFPTTFIPECYNPTTSKIVKR